MAFPLEILKSGIKIANNLTIGVQGTIIHEACIGQSGLFGELQYAAPVSRQCVIEYTNKQIIRDGQVLYVSAILTFVGDVAANGVTLNPARKEPFDTRDKITLPDGSQSPIIYAPNSVLDPGTNRGLIQVVMIGSRG